MILSDDWHELVNFLPASWLELADRAGALKGLRQDKDPTALLRTMLIHCAGGYSLRETAVRARQANLAAMSDVALLKRFRKCQEWFRLMCLELLKERGARMETHKELRLRIFDATEVEEPGPTGSRWRLHYSLSLPDLSCDHFSLSGTAGAGTAESFLHFPVAPGDFILADRGYCRGPGLAHLAAHGACFGACAFHFGPPSPS